MTRIATMALLCSACGADPGVAWVTNHSAQEYDLAALEYAILRVVPVGAPLPVDVRFYDPDGDDWTCHTGGRYHDDGRVDVVLQPGGCLADTALVHELIHWRLDWHYGLMDYEHDQPDWWIVPYVKAELAQEDPRCDAP